VQPCKVDQCSLVKWILEVETESIWPQDQLVDEEILLFAYGSLMRGEIHATYLTDSFRVGAARTRPGFRLVDVGQFPAMIVGGDAQVEGELYGVSRELLRRLDELKENGRLFQRRRIELEGGQTAEVYLMEEDKLRGRRRLRVNDWRRRFERPIGTAGRRGTS
jgi:gamma-glutamylcyclotransferase (GGCT)/AIG2-like uncharacterized protein YtfP